MSLTLRQKIRLTWTNGIRYLPLLRNLISRELKKKYRKSMLGYVWCVLNPLLIMIIMTLVFSVMFRMNITNFPVYLFSGRMMFSFITDSSASVMRSIIGNGQLMRKTRVPYYVFPLASMGSSMVNFFFQLIAFALVLIGTHTPITIHAVAFLPVALEMCLFSFGLGLLLAISDVYIRDTGYIYSVVTTGWMYLCALFYPIEKLPDIVRNLVVRFNPAYYFIDMSRAVFYEHQWPSPEMLIRGGAVGLIFLILGLCLYNHVKKDLILHV